MFNEYKFTTATATVSGSGEVHELKDTHFYCLKEVELKMLADLMFDKAYKKLERTLFFATGFGVVLGLLLAMLIN